jgi:hypothetical protein
MTNEEQRTQAVRVTLSIGAADVDPEELDRLTRALRTDIEELDIESVALATGSAPHGAKAGELVTIGALVVNLAPAALPGLVRLLQSWLQRERGRDVTVEAHDGDRSVHLEYSPEKMSQSDVTTLVSNLMSVLESKRAAEE